MTNLQNHLRNGGTVEQLKADFGISCKVHGNYPNLNLFKYSQIESNMALPIVQESRGIILDNANNWEIVARGYDKFFNHGEGHAAPIDWESAKVLEKLDGSLMQLFYYNNEWLVSSSGSCDASGQVFDFDFTFSQLFWKTFYELGYKLPSHQFRNETFMFELMTPFNQVVVRHTENKLVLHGARNIITGKELDISAYEHFFNGWFNWQLVKEHPFSDLDNTIRVLNELSPFDSEGVIVVDKNFNKIKIKNVKYVELHRTLGSVSKSALLELIKTNEGTEVLTYFPQFTSLYNEIEKSYLDAIADTEAYYNEIKDTIDQKDFALKAKTHKFSGTLFMLRAGKVNSVKESFNSIENKKLLSFIEG